MNVWLQKSKTEELAFYYYYYYHCNKPKRLQEKLYLGKHKGILTEVILQEECVMVLKPIISGL